VIRREEKCREARRAVENLHAALEKANDDPSASPGLRDALVKQLHRAQAKLAELTGSTEP
jgi:predicted metal-dependent hydrolase